MGTTVTEDRLKLRGYIPFLEYYLKVKYSENPKTKIQKKKVIGSVNRLPLDYVQAVLSIQYFFKFIFKFLRSQFLDRRKVDIF